MCAGTHPQCLQASGQVRALNIFPHSRPANKICRKDSQKRKSHDLMTIREERTFSTVMNILSD